ncbi:MAG: M24 family metallopeptidase, partial [Hyphomicrobiales bacterium]|nr:M24 family metallopeptidase [Hyphomicrobiales bacterium]
APPAAPIWMHPVKFAGEGAASKIARVRKALGEADALLVSDPHGLAWLFNLRGGDVAHTPIALGRALLPKFGKPTLFMAREKLPAPVLRALGRVAHLAEPAELAEALARLGRDGRTLKLDAATAPAAFAEAVEAAGGKVDVGADPIAAMKARKNAAELAGARAAHLRDGAALCEFLAWFDAEAPKGRLTEIDAALALEGFRVAAGGLRDLSFPSISAFGPHAAIPHYRVTERSNLRIGRGVYLIDGGGQYEDGTTDVTRTVTVGKPTREMRDRFTRVLQGHVAVAAATFPAGTTGVQLDALARRPLWEAGLDFDHGTGHGVGSCLSVHEGPQSLSKRGAVAIEAGMVVSDEPGYYKPGAFGIRCENLLAAREAKPAGAERACLGFETLTLAPFDLRLLDASMLTRAELRWLDAYHARVRREVGPLLSKPARRWLAAATAPLSRRRRA